VLNAAPAVKELCDLRFFYHRRDHEWALYPIKISDIDIRSGSTRQDTILSCPAAHARCRGEIAMIFDRIYIGPFFQQEQAHAYMPVPGGKMKRGPCLNSERGSGVGSGNQRRAWALSYRL
jgi:hypothetical protein